MSLSASLSAQSLTIAPGDSGVCEVTVRNTGAVVDSFAIGIVGEAAEWSAAEPTALNVYPGETGVCRITFRPPKSAKARAGTTPFGVRINSTEDPESSRVEEGAIEVLPHDEIAAELVPHVSAGRRSARFDVAVDNHGNRPMDVELFAVDGEAALRFKLASPAAVVEPGTTRLVRLQVRPKKGFLRGKDKTLPFTVTVQPSGPPAVEAEGSMVQQPLLPGWLVPTVAAAAALALAATAFWFTILKPSVKSTAKAEALQQFSSAASSSSAAAASASSAAAGAVNASASAKGGPAPSGTPSPSGPATPSSSASKPAPPATPSSTKAPPAPVVFRLQSGAAAGSSDMQKPGAALQGKPLQVSDVLFQNPNGDAGTMKILKQPASGPAETLYVLGLGNIRDWDYHVIQAWDFAAGDTLEVSVACANQPVAPSPAKACTAGVTFSGLSG